MNKISRLMFAVGLALCIAPSVRAGQVPQTLVHKPSGDKIQVESGGEIELKSGATLDIQAGATVSVTSLAPTVGYVAPTVNVLVTTPTLAGLIVKTSAGVVYVSTATVGVADWIKVGGQ